jgi:hypothetical protein
MGHKNWDVERGSGMTLEPRPRTIEEFTDQFYPFLERNGLPLPGWVEAVASEGELTGVELFYPEQKVVLTVDLAA